jgi:hypothetical protein
VLLFLLVCDACESFLDFWKVESSLRLIRIHTAHWIPNAHQQSPCDSTNWNVSAVSAFRWRYFVYLLINDNQISVRLLSNFCVILLTTFHALLTGLSFKYYEYFRHSGRYIVKRATMSMLWVWDCQVERFYFLHTSDSHSIEIHEWRSFRFLLALRYLCYKLLYTCIDMNFCCHVVCHRWHSLSFEYVLSLFTVLVREN